MKSIFVSLILGMLMIFSSACQRDELYPKKGEQRLRLNLKTEPPNLDPRKGSDMIATQIHFMLFEGLMRLEPDLSLTYAQAKSYEISADSKMYTFHLGDYKWSDGSPVTAYDFEQTWKDLLDPTFSAPDAYLLYPIKNAEAAKRNQAPLSSIGITAPDAKTLIVELEKPTPHFLKMTACSALLPVNQTRAKKSPNWAQEASKHFLCNGPFQLAAWKHHDEILVRKNPHYRNAHLVKLDSVQISMIDSEIAALHMYATGYFDILGPPLSPFPTASYHDLIQKDLLQLSSIAGSKFCVFNTKKPPFDNVHIRKAFSYAIHRQSIIDNITQLHELIATGAIPPVLKGGTAISYFPDHDVQLARAHFQQGLKELGLQTKDLESIPFTYWTNEMNNLIAQELQQQWLEALGVKIELQNVDFKTLQEKSKQASFSIALFAYVADYPDPMSILERFKYADNFRNHAKWSDPAYVQLLDRSEHAPSSEERLALLEKAEALFIDQMPIAPLFHWNYAFLVQPHVKGFCISPLGNIYFDTISLD